MRTPFRILGLGFAVAGASKLLRLNVQQRLFQRWGWSVSAMQTMGAIELIGGLLMSGRGTRQLGGAALTASSVAALANELDHGQEMLAPARLVLLLGALAATV